MRYSIFLPPGQELVIVRARLEGPGDRSGLFLQQVRPGESLFGWTYPELRALGDGMHDLQPKPATAPPSSAIPA